MEGALDGKLALVTGASRGIGAATAIALGAAGAHVVLTARTPKGLEEVEETIFNAGGSATIAPLDLIENESIGRLAGAIGERWQALDVLVLNAGMLGSLAAVPAIDAKEFARVLTLNVSAQAAMIAAFDPMLRRSDGARVIGVTSSVGRKPRAYWGAYGASKAAFETLLAAYGDETSEISAIRTAIVDPGATRTQMRAKAYPGEDPASVKAPEVVAERIAALAIEGFAPGHFERVGL
ncbi:MULTISPECIES: SDR family NAD(P)-dependent oxidoreductase [Sphingomonas]|jgi:NAD(P)-dependent dehydrogenase (short-subunit alcohol dehydrogenase family)|uniref:SDR family NAD(P)-dependent oxidoreductase n=1 Tax=Sphingomonas zeae TaxID=1646122 RepID=A0A7Y6B2M2_9SPHN|nr:MULTISPECIES: SDR family NAD(P)-dependent oxidoreductase [Sphingomonas]MBB4049923.1 NAD(P)-dependent dehydrogenase (short-subunit alcohol dehydrogenase family) [Sphingomonas zeae]MDK8185821.1 SDR family NAD(P)-dependent oxidoreductase [Sphingomonas zeae]MDK8215041.1 SDR family NAD(P)-dependent oxidoreductase [Sphingomonas sp. UMB7805-LC452B]NUU46286.1 SDR family NAD(P)-dependent oxidoreductase [Sphingomonas zeae]